MTVLAPREYELDLESFRTIAELAYQESGLTLVREKSSMICSRLRHRLRALGLADFGAYIRLLQSEAGLTERTHLISALTTNVSHFFRESHHFDLLAEMFRERLPTLRQGEEMRLWSAGCSNGQEALSAAITLLESARDADTLDLRILATDIDQEVVAFARAGVYPARLVNGIPAPMLSTYFTETPTAGGEPHYTIRHNLRSMVRFNQLNLLKPWPMRRRFDAVFCRNVVIYFDLDTQRRLWPKFREVLAPGGLLFLGHSERIADPEAFGFECVGPTTYRPIIP